MLLLFQTGMTLFFQQNTKLDVIRSFPYNEIEFKACKLKK